MPTVLVVDDMAVDRRLAGALLERQTDWKVQYAVNGADALNQVAAQLPEVMLVDLQMPDMNGLDLVEKLKRDYPLVPTVLMTAVGSEEIAARALQCGAVSYVPKSRLAADLVPTVHRVLTGSALDQTHSQLMHHLEQSAETFVLSNDLQLIYDLVEHLHEQLRSLPLADETERVRVGLAVEEALKNAYYHGNLEVGSSRERIALISQRIGEPPYRDRRIHVTARISRAEASFVIRDDGNGFDVSSLRTDVKQLDSDDTTGRGIPLMRSILDEVRFNDRGNEVTLVKRRFVDSASEASAE